MKRTTGLVVLLLSVLFLPAQQKVTLEQCYAKALENYPLTRQAELLVSSHDLTLKNLNKNYLPSMAINGQVHYQSDVTKVPVQEVPVFGVEPLEKDWYKVMLDVNQVIYDGSQTSRKKDLEMVNLEIEQQNLEIELYNLKARINQVFFNIVLLDKNAIILNLHKSTLEERQKTLESGVRNGTILASNLDILKAEILQVEQSLIELVISKEAAMAILREYTAIDLDEGTSFILPEVYVNTGLYENNRPEYALFSIQQRKIETSKKLIGSRNLPKLSAFGQAGYGRPGFDMLKNQFDDFYMVGARLSWNFWDWNHARKEREILDLRYDILSTQKETFDKHVRIDLENKLAGIRKAERLIEKDEAIIALREKITASSSSQLENGTINSTEYVAELNAESKARLDLEVHNIELVKAKLEYQTTLGNL
jgi:outer membrane protein TolC